MADEELGPRVDELEDDVANTRTEVAQLGGKVDTATAIAKAARDNAQATREDVQALGRQLAEFRKEVREAHDRGNALATATQAAVTQGKTWSDHLKDVLVALAPVLLALAALYAAYRTGTVPSGGAPK